MPFWIPLAIGAGVSAVSNLVGAKKGADAAKQAAKTQVAAGDRALAVYRQVYDDQRALMNPYVLGGQQAFAQMQQMAGRGPIPLGAAVSGAQPPMIPMRTPNAPAPTAAPLTPSAPRPTPAFPTPTAPTPMMATRPRTTQPMMLGDTPQAPATARVQPEALNDFVWVRGTDGETRQLPRHVAQQLVARGAQIVGGR